MSWVGLRSSTEQLFSPAGLGQQSPEPVDINTFFPRGTLMMTFAAVPVGGDAAQNLISYAGSSPWASSLTLGLSARGVLTLTQTQGEQRSEFCVATGLLCRASDVTVIYTWDAPAMRAAISVEIGDTGQHFFDTFHAPLPMSLRDAVRMMADPKTCAMTPRIGFAAIADHVMPHGPRATLAPSTLVQTPTGDIAIGALNAGDLVVASDGQTAQVRWAGATTVPARGRFTPQTLRAPFHGAKRDLSFAPDQRLQFAGTDVDYLFDTDLVAVRGGDLDQGIVSQTQTGDLIATYCQVVLDRCATLSIGGLAVESLDPTHLLTDHRLRAHSILADLPLEVLPHYKTRRVPVLRGFETLSLNRLKTA